MVQADRLVDGDGRRDFVPPEQSFAFIGYAITVVLAGLISVAPSFAQLPEVLRSPFVAEFSVIAVLAALVDLRPFVTPGRGPRVFPSIMFTYALLVGWDLGAAVAVQLVCVAVVAIRSRYGLWRALFNAGQYSLTFAATAVALQLGGPRVLAPETEVSLRDVVVMLFGAVVWFVVNDLLVTTSTWLRFGDRFVRTLTASLREKALATLGLLALGPLVVAAGNISAALVPLMLIPLYSVNELGRFAEEERRRAHRDELTRLPNRRALFAQIGYQARAYSARSRAARDQRRMALLLLDIDQFRRVNDALGHSTGDRLLIAVAQRLRDCVGADGFVARLGGDEFAVLAPRLTDLSAGAVLAQRVADALAPPVTLDGLPLDVTAAIGVAVYPDHGTDATRLLLRAEVAMYDAKDRGSVYAVYTKESDHNSPERLELIAELRRALELARPDEVQLYYQPQVDLASGAVVGVEALLRWHHPQRGLVDPEMLIKLAEHTAVMRVLTWRVLEDAIGQLAKWRAQGVTMRASINVSVRDLQRPELVGRLSTLLADRGVAPNQVQLEITEGALMADPRRVLVTLHQLDKLGVALSLDDFGTGYSSLQHLRRLPLAEVKIDRSFVLGMSTDSDDAAVVHSIIDLARALGLRVVAEGVEDDATRRMLIARGCEVAQGWFYARPMTADDLMVWLSRYPAPRPSRPGSSLPGSSPLGSDT